MTGPNDGFAGAQAALGGVKQQTHWINTQVSEGKLQLKPEAAEAAAKHCEDYETQIRELRRQYTNIGSVDGLGEYDSGKALKHHFEQKANHGQSGAFALLDQLRTELLNLADAYRAAKRTYEEQEQQISDAFKKGTA